MGPVSGVRGRIFLLAFVSASIGGLARLLLSKTLFLQADEEIFSYDAYYFILGKDLDFIIGKIGAYIGYPFMLSLWFRIAGVSLFSARIFTVLCWCVVIALVFLIMFEITRDERSSFGGALIMALLPFPLRYGSMALSEPFAWVFITGGILALTLALKRGKWYLYSLSGVLFVVASFSRRSALVLLFMTVPLIIWTHRGAIKRSLCFTGSFLAGFFCPLAIFLGGLISFFGISRLRELMFFSIPKFSQDFSIELFASGPFDNAFFALQPSIWKSLPLFLLLSLGGAFILGSVMRDRWRAVYLFCALHPPVIRLAFEGMIPDKGLFALMVLPAALLLFADRSKMGPKFLLALSVLLASSAAYSTFVLTGTIWNVIIYTTVGACVIVYLEDRVSGDIMTPVMAAVGLVVAITIAVKEPQIEKLITIFASGASTVVPLSLITAKKPPGASHLALLVPAVLLGVLDPSPLSLFASSLLALGGIVLFLVRDSPKMFSRARYPLALLAIAGIVLIPGFVPVWTVASVGAIAILGATFLNSGSHLPARYGLIIMPVSGAAAAWWGSGEFLYGFIAGSIFLAISLGALSFSEMTDKVRRLIDPRVGLMLVSLVISYLAFYVYYGWTEVYLTEFMVPSAIVGGILIFLMIEERESVRDAPGPFSIRSKMTFKRIKKASRTSGTAWRLALISALIVSIPCSVSCFLDDNWFTEERMDKRTYMRTIEEVSEWIRSNTDPDETITAWHSFAIQAQRPTILDVSNAAVYDGNLAIRTMEDLHVNVFVLCYYTNHGLWENQPAFQNYILSNYRVDRVIDGNSCFIRV